MIQSFTFDSGLPGKTLLVLGAVHGNEPCGPLAIKKVMNELSKGELTLQSGKIICVPVCNPKAYNNNTRSYEANLNRVFKPGYDVSSYEGNLATQIRKHIDQADYVVDLHSMSGGDEVCIFPSDETDPEVIRFAQSLGASSILVGSRAIYSGTDQRATEDYAYDIGKAGVCLECGQHNDPQALEVAYDAIHLAMNYLGILGTNILSTNTTRTIRFLSMHMMTKPGKFARERTHGDSIKRGETIAQYQDGTLEICQTDNTVILLPKHFATVGGERYFLGKEIS